MTTAVLPDRDAAQRKRDRIACKSRASFAAASNIGPIPPVKNTKRRVACKHDLLRFMVEYFPHSAGMSPLGEAQQGAIRRIQRCILHGGRFLNLLPRGFAKSTASEIAVIWASLYGHRRYTVYFGATKEDAVTAIDSIKRELQENELLLEDFPEAVIPIQQLEGKAQRCNGQHQNGALTHIDWTSDTVVLPTILVPVGWDISKKSQAKTPKMVQSPASGAIIRTRGLTAAGRGMRYKRADGVQARPDLAIIDDPQTDDSAISPAQCGKRLNVIKKSILRLGGHGHAVAAVMNATVIAEGDLVDQLGDHNRHAEWQSVRVPMVVALPTALETHWLGKYAEIRRSYDQHIEGDQKRAHSDATAYYAENREAMDEGAAVSWVNIPLEEGEISAVQHAMNILVDDGQDVFDSECQNSPKRLVVAGATLASEADICAKTNNLAHRVIPDSTSQVVFHIDVHDNIFYYSVAAVASDFTASIVDYGVYPKQPGYFRHATAKRTLRTQYPKLGIEEAIVQGLTDLFNQLCGTQWVTPSSQILPVSLGLADVGFKPDMVALAIKRSDHSSVLMGARGVGFEPENKPMTEYDTSPAKVRRAGPDSKAPRWYVPKESRGGIQVVRFDSGYWKQTLHSRLMVPAGGAGEWTLYGNHRTDHQQYAEHLASEEPIAKSAKGVTVNVWRVRGNRDNHWLDTAVGCLVAASVQGCRLEGIHLAPPPKRKVKKTWKWGIS